MKTVLFIMLITVFFILYASDTYSCSGPLGPCVDLNTDCGGYGGVSHCKWNGISCDGYCTQSCPSGPGEKYCEGYYGGCAPSVVGCSTMKKYTCRPRMYGPPDCVCDESGVGGNCNRQIC